MTNTEPQKKNRHSAYAFPCLDEYIFFRGWGKYPVPRVFFSYFLGKHTGLKSNNLIGQSNNFLKNKFNCQPVQEKIEEKCNTRKILGKSDIYLVSVL